MGIEIGQKLIDMTEGGSILSSTNETITLSVDGVYAHGDSPCIGTEKNPFKNIYGNVNSAGTSNVVYGAVFN